MKAKVKKDRGKYYQENKQYFKKYRDEYYLIHKEEIKEKRKEKYNSSSYDKSYYAKNRDYYLSKFRERKYKTTYGISIEEYDKIYEEQGGGCKICGRHQDTIKKRLHVDHDHKTGKVRGLLCNQCNVMIGMAFENPNVLTRAIKYIDNIY